MKRAVAMLAIAGLALAACGGDDDAGEPAAAAPAETEEPADEPAAEPAADDSANDSAGDGGDDAGGDAGGDAGVQSNDDAGDDDTGVSSTGDDTGDAMDSSSADPIIVRSLADVPDQCKDEMADFLRKIEPVVGSIDWQTATFADFEAIGPEFEALSEEFDEASSTSGCDAIEFEGVDEFGVLIEFASDVAPGTVGFFEFIDAFAPDDGGDDESAGSGGSLGTDSFDSCDDAVAYVEELMAQYDNFTEVPAAELMQFAELANVFMTCSPEQMEFFDSEAVLAFLEG